MSFKAQAPQEDPETKARREAAEARADAGRIESTQQELSQETLSVIRRFGRLSAFAGQKSLGQVPGISLGTRLGGIGAIGGGRASGGGRPSLTQFAN